MNNPESIVVSLEMAKRLKEAGFPQDEEMEFWWMFEEAEDPDDQWACLGQDSDYFFNRKTDFAAPTAEEILRRLPAEFKEEPKWKDGIGETWKLGMYKLRESFWWVGYGYPDMLRTKHTETAKTLANAAAAMYCYLAENSLLPKS